MPDFYSEPFLQLAGLTHRSALISWGAFYFKVKDSGTKFKLVDDSDLKHVHPPRKDTIGATSAAYGPARVEVFDMSGALAGSASTTETNFCWVTGLQPDTEYRYRVTVKDQEWAQDERRDWIADERQKGLRLVGKRYDNRFRTYPDPAQRALNPLTFAIIGDFGTGIKEKDRPQRMVADALMQAVDHNNVRFILTTGDNIYASKKLFGLPIGDHGDEDDDWYFTYYQPYRYIINRVPVYPSIGNHDTAESEERDDRDQVIDNLYVAERIKGEEAAGRASMDPGLFYRFRYGSEIEFICIDTSRESPLFADRLYKHPKHAEFINKALPVAVVPAADAPAWRIPFGHHPPFSAGPRHHNTPGMDQLVQQFEQAGVRVVFSGHEHNFQHSLLNGVHYFVTGAAGKLRSEPPNKLHDAHTQSWSATLHFLLVTIQGRQMTIRAIGMNAAGELTDITRTHFDATQGSAPIIVTLD
jgi:tartrate-resistant acid phosphatase type 5